MSPPPKIIFAWTRRRSATPTVRSSSSPPPASSARSTPGCATRRAHGKSACALEVIETLRAQGARAGFTPREQLLTDIPLSLVREHGLSDELFARAEGELIVDQSSKSSVGVGHYSTISFIAKPFPNTQARR